MASSEIDLSFDYDVFLSHSSADKAVVEVIARRLLQESVRPFLDKWHLVPGDVWEEGLEEGLDASRTFAVFVGSDGIAPWQNEEMRSALDDRVQDRSRRVIPVLLPAAKRPASKDLPRFLRRATWVDLSRGVDEEGLRLLICGVKGLQPGPPEALPKRTESAASERLLRAKVYHLGADNEPVPEPNYKVVCEETGKSATTDHNGFFDLPIPTAFQQGETLTLQVKKTGWRVRYPVNGEVTLPADLAKVRVPIELLPNGSKLFLTHDQIEALIEKISEASARDTQRSTTEHEPTDFGDAIRAWADARRLDPDQTREAVATWIEKTKDESEDPRRLGLAAIAEKRFTEAADYFESAAEHNLQQLEDLAEEEDRLRRQVVNDLRRQGDALSNAYRFRDAIAAYERALEQAPQAHMPHLWAATLNDLGNARWAEGIRCSPTTSASYLEAAIAAYRLALEVYQRDEFPRDWARTHNNLANALQDQGIRSGGGESRDLLEQAVNEYGLALQVLTRDALPEDWAMTQNNLGLALMEQGIRTGGEHRRRILEQAVQACRLALEVYTRDDLPQDWAMVQANLGIVLREEGIGTGGAQASRLFWQATQACRLALEVYTRDEQPQDWARTQNNLGLALQEHGSRTYGEQARNLLEQAVEAYRLALQIRTHHELPQQWGMTQNNLGNTLQTLGIRTAGEEGQQFLEQAVDAYRLVLTVYNRDESPRQWGMTLNNLASALKHQGSRTEGDIGLQLLKEAATAHRQVREIRSRDESPQDWATSQTNLGNVLMEQAVRIRGEKRRRLLRQALAAHEQSLEIFTKEHLPGLWTIAYRNRGKVLFHLGRRDEAEAVFAELGEPVPDLPEISGDEADESSEA